MFIYNAKDIMLIETISKKSTYFIRHCKSYASSDVQQIIIKILLKMQWNYIELMIFYK